MKKILINGLSLGTKSNVAGIQRACRELIYRVDNLLENDDSITIKYIYNPEAKNIVVKPEELKNITPLPVRPDGRPLWKYRIVRKAVKKEAAKLCCVSLDTVFVRNQISFIYDLRAVAEKYDTLKFRLKYKLFLQIQKLNAELILTDSNYQNDEIVKYLRVKHSKVKTIYMGYEHVNDIESDNNIFEKYPILKERQYYFALGSLAPHKNFNWIEEVAKRNNDKIFAIAGGKDLNVWKDNVEIEGINNLLFLGYVSDEEMKALMNNCLAFIHPSKYEGFGIPPLEALACGTKVFLSNATCLPEIYEDCAVYFDPDDYDVNLDEMQNRKVGNPEKIFAKCSWDKSANQFLNSLRNS